MVARSGTMPGAGGQASASQIPWGWLGYAQVVANQTTITAQVDLTGLTLTLTLAASRRIKITAFARLGGGADGTVAQLYIMEGATQLAQSEDAMANASGNVNGHMAMAVLTPSAGAHTYKVQVAATATTSMLASAAAPAFILVEDIGPAT